VRHPNGRGQSLVEFALVFPVLVLAIGGVIQAGTYFWAQSTLEQVAHDLGRWAVTQRAQPVQLDPGHGREGRRFRQQHQPHRARERRVHDGDIPRLCRRHAAPGHGRLPPWRRGGVDDQPRPVTPVPCPAPNNAATWFVTIRLTHTVPVFFPLLPIPSAISVTTTTQMEPTT
jgi:hypothetical protein